MCAVFLYNLLIFPDMTYKTDQMSDILASVRAVSTSSKPSGSETAGSTSIKLGTYILLVSEHNFQET